MLQIIQFKTDEHRHHLRELLWEFTESINQILQQNFNITLDVNNAVNVTMDELTIFAPPEGSLLLASYDSQIVGCLGLQKISDDAGEIKRMYVQPHHRRKGIGRALLTAIIEEARQIGYSKILLHTPAFLKESHALYYSCGFQKIQRYPESNIPEKSRISWLFMEKILQNR